MSARLTLDQFRATGRDCADLGAELEDEAVAGVPGRIYVDALYVESIAGRWQLTIANCQSSGALDDLEAELYDWACDEGYCDESPSRDPQDPENLRDALYGGGT